MAIITISRGSYSKGREVAKEVAQKLGYECVAREVLVRASETFNIPEVKFAQAMHDAPSILDRLTYGKEKYVAYFQAALLKRLQRDNVVYHGLAGHFFIKGISHALKVRIISDMDERVRVEMGRESISKEAALQALKKDDEERRKWSRHLYGIDTADSSLYDLVIHIGKITVADATELICQAANFENFKTTFESQKEMDDLVLAAEVKAALIDLKPDVQVKATKGNIVIGTRTSLMHESELVNEVERIARDIPGVKEVEVKISHLVDWTD